VICDCGGATFPKKAANKSRAAELSWQRCGACGRCGDWQLEVRGKRVKTGDLARRAFNDHGLLEQVRRRIARGGNCGER